MARQLNIRSDEAVETAKRLAKRHGLTTTEVVVRALRQLDDAPAAIPTFEDLTPKQKLLHNRLIGLAQEAHEANAGAASDHDWLYGEDGASK